MSGNRRIDPELTRRARELRHDAPVPERLLWSRLRAKQLEGVRFRRQHAVGPYIADFYCPQAQLVIELDGRSHEGREAYDDRRTRYMEEQGLRVIRFTDDDVIRDIDAVILSIARKIGLDV